MSGLQGSDYILGLSSNDNLSGDNGTDSLIGGTGDDVIDGGGSDDAREQEGQRQDGAPHRRHKVGPLHSQGCSDGRRDGHPGGRNQQPNGSQAERLEGSQQDRQHARPEQQSPQPKLESAALGGSVIHLGEGPFVR